ncbi:tetratricopeptide repeat-containing sensor histidine kinase [Kordia sp.]|uniref:tetratricopeptide repeat-containing sensor histidine kinase n=1 Tax=Kordia sp. TaxID=1965332 RepID=UPI003D28BAD8
MKQLYLFFFFSLLSFFLFGQQSKIDSLKQVINHTEKKLVTIYDFCNSEKDKSKIEDFRLYIDYLIEEAKIQNEKKYISFGNILLSDKYQRIGDYDNAIKTINNTINNTENKFSDSIRIVNFNQKAKVLRFFNQKDSSFVYYSKAISLGEKSEQYRPLGYAYNGLASLHTNMGNYTEAIKTQQKCLVIATDYNFEYLQIISLIGLSWIYISNENYSKSLEYLKDAERRIKIIDNPKKEQECDIYRFIGLNYSKLGNLVEGNNYNQKALKCLEETDNLILAADVANTIGANYLRSKQYKKSIPYFKKLISKAQKLKYKQIENYGIINLSRAYIETNQLIEGENILLQILNDTLDEVILPKKLEKVIYQNLSNLYDRNNNFKTSLNYHKKFKNLDDSLASAQKLKEVSEIDAKYNNELKEKENLQLKADNVEQELLTQKANTRNWLLILGLITLGISAFFIWRRYKSEAKGKQIISKQKDEIEQQKNMVETLQKELHHRMKNNLSFIDLFINLAKGRFPNQAYQTKLNELQNRMRSMFEVHKQLFKKDDVTSVQAKSYIDTLTQNVKEAYAKNNVTIVNTTDSKETILADTSFPVGLIVNEFVTNSYKYAFDDNEQGAINIELTSDTSNYHLSLKDNGKGLPTGFNIEDLDSFGMETIQLLTKEYMGTFTIDGSDGVTMDITLPKTAA